MAKRLKLYHYVSRAKVAQLYDQLHDFSVSEHSVQKDRKRGASVETKASIFALFTGEVKGDMNAEESITQTGSVTTMQKLAEVLGHIEKHEKVEDLNSIMAAELMDLGDAFCYTYRGDFAVLGVLPGRPGRFYGSTAVYDSSAYKLHEHAYGLIAGKSAGSPEQATLVVSNEFNQPARQENDFKEVEEDGRYLVSDICILGSITGQRLLQLACSFKYFNTMVTYGQDDHERYFIPDSSSAQFFIADHTIHFEGIVFITGVDGMTVMGTPLMLGQ